MPRGLHHIEDDSDPVTAQEARRRFQHRFNLTPDCRRAFETRFVIVTRAEERHRAAAGAAAVIQNFRQPRIPDCFRDGHAQNVLEAGLRFHDWTSCAGWRVSG
ncbi:hypothetical protein SDC9_79830 [bioreactor metagenome]|uniref:Uncharacterized protein n=1 Tax=bioreactor metagenome TaxID=1076179 RepID=A0A644YXC0_9ZZZZ